jgi:hypothetical protein
MAISSPSHKAKLVFDELGGFDSLERDIFYGSEGKKHYISKLLAAKLISDAGRDVAVELELDDGSTIDVLDLGESEECARAIELETAFSPQTAREKYERYAEDSELIGDVHVLPISEAPNDLDKLESWLKDQIPAV